MSYSTEAIANFFLDLAATKDKQLRPMKLQKLVYYAHGWHLALTGEPLIDEPIQAWRYGPVIPSLYHEFKDFGDKPITKRATSFSGDWETCDLTKPETPQLPEDAPIVPLLNKIWDLYSPYSGIQLSNATHAVGTPWRTIFDKYGGQLEKGQKIPNELIKEHFESLRVKK